MGTAVSYGLQKSSESRLPPLDGTISLPILDKQGTIKYDTWGCPHIYASTRKDGYRLQGFVVAQHRLFQLVQTRLVIHGKLSSVVGAPAKPIDVFSRTCNFAELGKGDWEYLIKHKQKYQRSIDMVSSYTEGINAWLTHPKFVKPVELSALILNYDPQFWTETDVMSVARLLGIKMSVGWNAKILSTLLIQLVGFENAEWFSFDTEKVYHSPYNDTQNKVGDFYLQLKDIGKLLEKQNQPILGLKRSYFRNKDKYCSPLVINEDEEKKVEEDGDNEDDTVDVMNLEGGASNAFVIGGQFTENGKPILCNDPHLTLNVPNTFFYCHITVESEENKEENMQFTGVQAVGMPAMSVGHTEHVALGITLGVCDTTDIFVERFENETSNKYEVDGEWKDCKCREEIIHVKGEEDYILMVRETHHGPILEPTDYDKGLEKGPYSHLMDTDDDKENEKYCLRYSLCATFLKPREEVIQCPIEAMERVINCSNMIEAAGHLRKCSFPNLNFMLADTKGNYGWCTNGMIPIREAMDDYNPMLPQPGWMSKYDWKRYIPEEEIPHNINPKCGYVVSCNNKMVDDDKYPYYLGFAYHLGFRAKRASQLIDKALMECNDNNTKITVDDMTCIQCDVLDLSSKELIGNVLNTFDLDNVIENHKIDVDEWILFVQTRIIPKEIRDGVDVDIDYYNDRMNRNKAKYAWNVLHQWDNEYTEESLGAPLYEAFLIVFLRRVFFAGIYRAYAENNNDNDDVQMDATLLKKAEKMSMNIMRNVHNQVFINATPWFFKRFGQAITILSTTCEAEKECLWIQNYRNKENLMLMTLIDVVDCIEFWSKTSDKSKWNWGSLHEIEVFHPVSAKIGPQPFNSDIHSLRGGPHTLNMCRSNFEGIIENPLKVIRGCVPTWRQIVDCSDWSKCKCLLPMGNSGQCASPFYQNQLKMFVDCEYIPMLWNKEDVETHKSSELICDPLRNIEDDEQSYIYCQIL